MKQGDKGLCELIEQRKGWLAPTELRQLNVLPGTEALAEEAGTTNGSDWVQEDCL